MSSAGSFGATTPAEGTLTFSVVGDSITAGRVPNGPLVAGSGSWVPTATGAPLEFRPSWAVSGATTEDMRRGVTPSDADVAVIMGGTNDVLRHLPWETTADDIRTIATAVGTPQIVLSAIPPNDLEPTGATALNQHLEDLADTEGWDFVDPWTGLSDDGRYRRGASADGTHPTVDVAKTVGQRIRKELLTLR